MAPRLLLATLLFAAGCTCITDSDCPLDQVCSDGRCVAPPPGGGGGDTTPPTAALTSPAGGAPVSGTVTLTASASDDVGVTSVDFAVDGTVVATATGAPYSVTWTSSSVWNGPHSITATAHDAAGNTGTSAAVSVSVGNYPGAALSVHTAMGLADAATADPSNKDHFLSVKHQYVLSYSGTRRTPNWVSWELNTTWLGSVPRQDDFRPDDTFPPGFPQALLADYLNSGYDRGHMCPSADRTATLIDNENTFYLTNMVPQADNVNGGPWAQLESYARSLATSGKEIFEIAGGIYAGAPKTVGADAVAVPSSTFKVVVVLDTPGQTAANVTTSTRVISVIMPNDNAAVAKSADWHTFRVKAADIESQTGLRLLSDVAEPVRTTLENRIDTAP
jgi:endonuclease G